MNENYYEILEVYPAATLQEIETAYRMLLYKYHPDHNPDRAEWAHKMTAKVVEAFQWLSNPEKRKLHNFQIYCQVKRKAPERRFMFFQGKQKKQWELSVAHFKAGVMLFDRQKAKAMAKFRDAVLQWPKFPEALYNIGLCLVDMHKYDEARNYFKKVMGLNPKDQEIHRTLRRLDELSKK
ncbi:DnaJ domain-containing protein [candidate division FCPU426 bacterium]|nr:DnaJ domain-containing protein [candidate division FCPU426 bacterium]